MGRSEPVADKGAEQSSAGVAEEGQREGVEVGHDASGAATRRGDAALRTWIRCAVTSAISIIRPVSAGAASRTRPVASGLARGWRRDYSGLTAHDSATGRAHPAVGAPCSARLRRCAGRCRKQVEFGIAVAQRGLWREAIYRWQRATEIDPTYAHAFNNLAHRATNRRASWTRRAWPTRRRCSSSRTTRSSNRTSICSRRSMTGRGALTVVSLALTAALERLQQRLRRGSHRDANPAEAGRAAVLAGLRRRLHHRRHQRSRRQPRDGAPAAQPAAQQGRAAGHRRRRARPGRRRRGRPDPAANGAAGSPPPQPSRATPADDLTDETQFARRREGLRRQASTGRRSARSSSSR